LFARRNLRNLLLKQPDRRFSHLINSWAFKPAQTPGLKALPLLQRLETPKNTLTSLTPITKTLHARILSGSIVLLSGSGIATGVNLAYNVAVARFLGPTGFGHATVVYTLLTLISAVTLSFQIVSAKVVAQQATAEGKSAVYRGFQRSAWACGIAVAVVLFVFQGVISDYLKLPTPTLVALLAVGAAFYVPLGSRRGYVQGTYGFRRLAFNLVLEGVIRLGGSLLLIGMGYGVRGVIAANSAAVAVAYLAIRPKLAARVPNPLSLSYAFRETAQALVFFLGQVLINNCDIVLVKHFFPPKVAGLYAAIAMVGRVIYAFSSAVVNSMFPLVAGTREEERKDLKVIATSLALVSGIGSVLAIFLGFTPAWIWTTFFGAGFEIAGPFSLPYLLALYAITTIIYSLSVVIITYEMSYKIANTSWVQLAFSGVLIAGICRFHSSLHQVILVQLDLMIVLFVMVALPFLVNSLSSPRKLQHVGEWRPLRVIRRVSEDEVIAEFLKSDFHYPAFREYQDFFREIVANPKFDDEAENAKRRALLYIRHLSLWKELPIGTEWFEVEVKRTDLDRIRVFPRAQWRKLARGNFSMSAVIDAMETHYNSIDPQFLAKISSIRKELRKTDFVTGAVLLIGLNETEPLTVLDGNHRLVAAMLETSSRMQNLRFICGLSPRMTECCWYNTNLVTLFKYGKNVLTHTRRDPEAELARLLQSSTG
jgi:O-antigen/teichoic acid export membrane protein